MKIDVQNIANQTGQRAIFTLNGNLVATGRLAAPSVQGKLLVSDATAKIPAQVIQAVKESPVPIPLNPKLAIDVGLAKNVTIERGALRAQVEGPVTVTGSAARPIAAGTVRIIGGRLSYIGRTLQLVPGGTIVFLFAPPNPPKVTIDLSAKTSFSIISPITNRPTRYTVTIDASGPIATPSVDVRSSPPGLTETESLGFAFGGQAVQTLGQTTASQAAMTQQVGQVLLGVALPSLFQTIQFGVVSFAVEPGLGGPTTLTTGIALSEKVSLSYSRAIAGQYQIEQIGLSYALTPKLALTLQLENQNGGTRNTYYLIEYFTRY
jgi:autotransporter translocation and assembly factor TamB